ncbi:hypothetical protein D3C78_1932460 [compost metagenome]
MNRSTRAADVLQPAETQIDLYWRIQVIAHVHAVHAVLLHEHQVHLALKVLIHAIPKNEHL